MKLAMIDIAKAASKFYGLDLRALRGESRAQQIYRPRQLAMVLCRDHTGKSLPEIGRFFGNRDHTSVLQAIRDFRTIRYIHADVINDRADILESARQYAGARLAQEREWVENLHMGIPYPPPPDTIARPAARPKTVMAIARALETGVLVRVEHHATYGRRQQPAPPPLPPSAFVIAPERLRAGRA